MEARVVAGVVKEPVPVAPAFFVSVVCLAFLVRVFASGFGGFMASVAFAFLLFAAGCFFVLVAFGFEVVCGVVVADDGVETGKLAGGSVGGGCADT